MTRNNLSILWISLILTFVYISTRIFFCKSLKNKTIQLLFKNIFIFYYNIVSRYFRVGFLRSSREFLAIFSIFSRNSWSVWSQLFLKPTSVASLWLPHSLVLEIKVGLIRKHLLMMSDDFWPPTPPNVRFSHQWPLHQFIL